VQEQGVVEQAGLRRLTLSSSRCLGTLHSCVEGCSCRLGRAACGEWQLQQRHLLSLGDLQLACKRLASIWQGRKRRHRTRRCCC
jgi:hypothetical protein